MMPSLLTRLGSLLLAVAACTTLAQPPGRGTPPEAATPGFTPADAAALEQRLNRFIVEQGVVESSEVLELRSGVRGEAVIRFVVENGSMVEEGDVLVAFDDTALQAQVLEQEHTVEAAARRVAAAEAARATAKEHADTKPLAELRLEVATRAREHAVGEGGELAAERSRLNRRIELAGRRAIAIKQQPDSSEGNNRLRDLHVQEAEVELADAMEAKRLLDEHALPLARAEADLAVAEAKRAVAAEQAAAAQSMREAEATVAAAQAAQALAEHHLNELRTQLAACELRAPRSGVVLHAQPRSSRSATAGIAPGATVREQQPLLTMPDLTALQVRVRVHESQVARVKPGQPVELQCDAALDQIFTGRVTTIGRVPEPSTWLTSDVVEYPVTVTVDDLPPSIRLGMTATARIDTGE